MSDYYLGEIRLLGFNKIPSDFAACNGQSLTISGNEALFAVIGTTYGGDGVVTFNLPDLRGRVPVHVGQGTGLSNYALGQKAGVESVTVGVSNLPAHTHTVSVSKNAATTMVPGPGLVQGDVGSAAEFYCNQAQAGTQQTFAADTVSMSNNSAAAPVPHSNMQPTMALTYAICISGLFPYNS